MDVHIELQDTDARFSLFSGATYELAFGGLSVHMNAEQFQQLCDNLRPWVVDDTARPAKAEGDENLTELCAAAAGLCCEQVYSDISEPDYEPEDSPSAVARNRHQRAYWRLRSALSKFNTARTVSRGDA